MSSQETQNFNIYKIEYYNVNTLKKLEIKDLVFEISFYNSIYLLTEQCSLVISDSTAFMALAPLQGGDYIDVFIEGASTRAELDNNEESKITFRKRYYVVKIYNIQHAEKTKSYMIDGVSEAYWFSAKHPISRSYKKPDPNDGYIFPEFLKKLYEDHIYDKVQGDFKQYLDNTTINTDEFDPNEKFNWIIPSQNPLEFFSKIIKQAVSIKNIYSKIYFFESHNGYVLGTLEEYNVVRKGFMSKDIRLAYEVIPTQYNGPSSSDKDGREIQKCNIITLRHLDSYNMLEALNLGMLGGTQHTINIGEKILYEYQSDHRGLWHFRHKNIEGVIPIFQKEPDTDYRGAFKNLGYTSKFLYDNIKEVYKSMKNASAYTRAPFVNTGALDVVVRGDARYEAGRDIEVESVAIKHHNENDVSEHDSMYSGTYYVTSVRHKFTKVDYTCTLRLEKSARSAGKKYKTVLEE